MTAGGAEPAFRFASAVRADPSGAVARWKALSGAKAVGCAPVYVPEEVLHAGGMLPVTIWGNESPAPPPSTLPAFLCSVAHGIFASLRGGLGERVDAWVFPSTCDTLRNACEALAAGDPRPSFQLEFPVSGEQAGAAEHLLDRIEALCEWASAVGGRAVGEGALERSVRIYNENRRRMARLEARMAECPGAYSAAEYQVLARAGMVLPKEAHNELLAAALSRPAAPARSPRARVFLCGMAAPDAVMEALDGAGGVLVGNDLALGHRYYGGLAAEEGDVLLALVRRHFARERCPTLHRRGGSRARRVFERALAAGADRVLLVRIRSCEPEGGDLPSLAGAARDRGVPFLCLDTDLAGGERAALGVRVKAFLETGE